MIEINQDLSKKIFFAGISLSNSPNYDSGIAILDKSSNIIFLDKFYETHDLDLFFKNYMSLKETVFCVSMPSNCTLLEGKWRIHSKNYKMLHNRFEVNRNDWKNRLSTRYCDNFAELKNRGISIFRFDIMQLRNAYNLYPTYPLRSSSDCKSFLTALKIKYKFRSLPDNMPPVSSLEAILGAMFAKELTNENIQDLKVQEFRGLDVLFKKI